MQDVFRAIGRLSQSIVTVLITGESGSGKELVAQALHKHSPRAQRPFVAINTAAIPKDLLESELFGHERGAFTGAQTTRRGRFEQADGGTLFLDEIGDMPFDLQTRLLRVLCRRPVLPRRRPQPDEEQRARHRGDAPGPRGARQGRARSARTCSTASTSSACACRRCASAARTSRRWRASSCRRARASSASRQAHHRRGDRPPGDVRLSGQRPPAREHLPLADGDGAGAGRSMPKDLPPELQVKPRRRRGRVMPARRGRRRGRRRADRAAPAAPSPRRRPRDAAAAAARRRPPASAAGSPASSASARELLAGRRADGLGHADAQVRGAADPLRARDDARPPHRGGAKLGIGRNTITRKIQELGLDDK